MASADTHLLSRIAAGDRAAFAAFYDRHAPQAYALILGILKNQADADDVLQETFLQVWQQAARFDPARAGAEAWLLLMARSRAVDRLRKRGPGTAGDLPEASAESDPGLDIGRREEAGRLCAALDVLPPEQREPLCLAFFDGMTHDQIARRLGLPLGTVKTRIRAAMARLRAHLEARSANGETP